MTDIPVQLCDLHWCVGDLPASIVCIRYWYSVHAKIGMEVFYSQFHYGVRYWENCLVIHKSVSVTISLWRFYFIDT